jgi:hypothetical protein
MVSRVLSRSGLDASIQYAIAQIIGYVVITIGFFLALQNTGINLSALTVFAGAVGVGVGLGLQNISSNFISGLILLAERPIKIGDRVEVHTVAGRVTEIRARSTTVVTNDNITLIVPNSVFVEHTVTNWSHGGQKVRFRIPAGVAFGSDLARVKEALLEVARNHPATLSDPEPRVFFESFGDSALNLELVVWSAEMSFRPRRFRSDATAVVAGGRTNVERASSPVVFSLVRSRAKVRQGAQWKGFWLGLLINFGDQHLKNGIGRTATNFKSMPLRTSAYLCARLRHGRARGQVNFSWPVNVQRRARLLPIAIAKNGRSRAVTYSKSLLEGPRERAYFGSRESVQCLRLVSSRSEKSSFDILREIEGGSWTPRRVRRGGGDSRLPAPFQAERLSQERLRKPGASFLCSKAFAP